MCQIPFFVPNPIFCVNTPEVAIEGVGQSPPNFQGSCPEDLLTQTIFWQHPHVGSCLPASKMYQNPFLGKHPYSSHWRGRPISTKFSGELPKGWGTFWHTPYSGNIHMWGAVYQRVKCAKSRFWANTPRVAIEGVGQSPPNFQGSCPGDGAPSYKDPILIASTCGELFTSE